MPEPQKCQMTDKLQGEVAFWNGNSFGFIKPDTGDQDVFFHVSDLSRLINPAQTGHNQLLVHIQTGTAPIDNVHGSPPLCDNSVSAQRSALSSKNLFCALPLEGATDGGASGHSEQTSMRARSTSDSPLSGRRHHLYYRSKSIFIGGGAPNWGMNNSYENAVFGAELCEADWFLCAAPASWNSALQFSSTVVNLKRSWGTLLILVRADAPSVGRLCKECQDLRNRRVAIL